MKSIRELKIFDASSSRLHEMVAEALAGDPVDAGFEVDYQPIVRLEDANIVAVEALARWRHPVAGRIDPDIFVACAEQLGLMGILDDFVLNRVCADAGLLREVYGQEVDLHVNISASRLGRLDLEAAILWALDRHGLRPGRLTLEITETSRIVDLDAAAAAIGRIRAGGVRVALDDFGSGFNTLRQLHALSIDVVKLDAALTSASLEPWRTEALCRSVLTICKDMGVIVVAEGIETVRQVLVLQHLGCQLGQGYLYGIPQPLERPQPQRQVAGS